MSRGLQRAKEVIESARFTPTRRFALLLACTAPLWLLSGWAAGTWLAASVLLALLVAKIVDSAMLPGKTDLTVQRTLDASVGVGRSRTARTR